ncbi:unnamed protein product [Lymnaea stagnalis]|uniref:Uncharacterized protein n=1 Tax=Lymnaea stagnalis TaxID=6523 RepID=A0AAV2I6I7_LYMST
MQYNNFIFEMRPECIFINTQLGERNRGPSKTKVQIQSPKSIPGLTDLRDYDSYPDLYWQLRSDTISQPEDLEGEMLDRDLYKLKQISNLKLSTLESAIQHDPFRKWRGKAGDPLFCPVRNVQDRQLRGKKVMDLAKKENKSFQRVEGNTPRLELEVKSTPIRPVLTEQEEYKKSAEAISQSSKRDIETDSVTLNLLDQSSERNNSIEASSSSESKSSVNAPPNTYVRLEPDDDDEKYINLSKELFRKSPNAKHRREVLKEVMRPTVVSFDLKREVDYKHHRQTIPRRYQMGLMNPSHDHVVWATPCRRITPQPQSVTSRDTLEENFHRENQHQSLIPRNGGRHGDAVFNDVYSLHPQPTTSSTRPTQLHGNGNDEKTAREAHDGDKSSFYSRRKSSPAPLKALHLEVFNERVKVNDLGKISRSTFDPDIPGYKLDLINYPPNNPSQICSGPKTTASESNVRFGDPVESTSRSKHAHTAPKKRTRELNRPSRSADSTYLKIMAYG